MFASENGLKVTVEDAKCVQANAFIQAGLFQNFRMKEAQVTFKINITVLLVGIHSCHRNLNALWMYVCAAIIFRMQPVAEHRIGIRFVESVIQQMPVFIFSTHVVSGLPEYIRLKCSTRGYDGLEDVLCRIWSSFSSCVRFRE